MYVCVCVCVCMCMCVCMTKWKEDTCTWERRRADVCEGGVQKRGRDKSRGYMYMYMYIVHVTWREKRTKATAVHVQKIVKKH